MPKTVNSDPLQRAMAAINEASKLAGCVIDAGTKKAAFDEERGFWFDAGVSEKLIEE